MRDSTLDELRGPVPQASGDGSLLAAARELVAQLEQRAQEIDEQRRLPNDLLELLRAAGFLRMMVPREYGGDERSPLEIFEALELLAAADASTAWVMTVVGTAPGFVIPFAEHGTIAAIYGTGRGPDAAIAGNAVPKGTARRIEGGYRLSGRWPMATGSQFADWYLLSFLLVDERGPVLDAANLPEVRMAIVPADSVEVIDTWSTIGLRGTGSNDVVVDELVVEDAWTLALDPSSGHVLPNSPVANRNFAFVSFPFALTAAVALGIFRRAIAMFSDIAQVKKVGPTMTSLRETVVAQRLRATAEASLRSSRLYLLDATRALLDVAAGRRTLTPTDGAEFRLAIAHAMKCARDGVTELYHGVGSTGIYAKNHLERVFRDIHTLSTHYATSEACFDNCGRVLFGLPAAEPFY